MQFNIPGTISVTKSWISTHKWWLIGIAGAAIVIYLVWPSYPDQSVDIKAMKEQNAQLEQAIKLKDADNVILLERDKIKTVIIDSLEKVIALQQVENDKIEGQNDLLVSKYQKAKEDKDTVKIVATCDDLKFSLVKTQNALRVTTSNGVKVQRELKASIQIKDELLTKANEKINLLTMANQGLTTQNIDLGIKLNKSERKRKRNARWGKIVTIVAVTLAAIQIGK